VLPIAVLCQAGWRLLLLGLILIPLFLTGCYRQVVFAPPKPSKPKAAAPAVKKPTYPLYYVAVSRLNLRACPGMDCPRISLLGRNQALEKLGETEDWYQVRIPQSGTIGWVSSRYLSVSPVPEPLPKKVVTPTPTPEPPAVIKPEQKPAEVIPRVKKPETPEEREETTPQVKKPEAPTEKLANEPPIAASKPSTPAATTTPEAPEEPTEAPSSPAPEPGPKRIRIM